MNYEESLKYLQSVDSTMSRYEREGWDRFVKKIGLHLSVPFIHLTGSNGKGSTAKYLYEIYRAKGLRVALFAKPYLYAPTELIEINGKKIGQDTFAKIFTSLEKDIRDYDLSAFEAETAIAFTYINEEKPDLAIIECGMGGTLDSTNIEGDSPLLSIITTVSLEHTAFLGRTISEIASSKAGIIKKKCPVLVGKLPETAITTIRDIANSKESDFFTVDDYHQEHYASPYFRFDYRPYKDLAILTPASYQLLNASIAIEATKILGNVFPMDEFSLRKGLMSAPLPGRLEKHHSVILDGAHNPEAIEALTKCLESYTIGKTIHVLFASFRDKNIAVEFPILGRIAEDITLTTFPEPRARKEEDYFLYVADYPYVDDYKVALSDLVSKYPDDIILVTGSLAFVALARRFVIDTLKI